MEINVTVNVTDGALAGNAWTFPQGQAATITFEPTNLGGADITWTHENVPSDWDVEVIGNFLFINDNGPILGTNFSFTVTGVASGFDTYTRTIDVIVEAAPGYPRINVTAPRGPLPKNHGSTKGTNEWVRKNTQRALKKI